MPPRSARRTVEGVNSEGIGSLMRRRIIGFTVVVLSLAAAGCGGSNADSDNPPAAATTASSSATTVDMGGGYSFEVGDGPLKIAFFTATGNEYLSAQIKAAEETAEKVGASLTVFDSKFDAATQANQVQDALTSGKFNAFIMQSVQPDQICTAVRRALEQGVLVSVVNQAICKRGLNEGEELWEPGTVDYVGGTQTKAAFKAWLDEIVAANPGPQKAAVLMGLPTSTNTLNTIDAIEEITREHPDFKVVAKATTDYSVAQGQQKAQDMLQAHPDLTLVISNYSDVTKGALQAVTSAGRADAVTVYDYGANRWAVDQVKAGKLGATGLMLPYTEVASAVQDLAAAWTGEGPAKFNDLAESDKAGGSLVIDRERAQGFTPEY